MFIKRSKPRPSLRTRGDDDDEPSAGSPLAQSAADESPIDVDEGAGSVMERKKAQRKSKFQSKSSRLSFGGSEASEATPFKQKKSLLSQTVTAAAAASTPSSAPAASQSYSREYLSELKASTPSRGPKDDEPMVNAVQDKYESMIIEDSTAGIPDPAQIAAAKNRRKAALEARRAGTDEEEDFISLGGGKDGPHPESRLMREEDEGDQGDEDLASFTEAHDRLYLGKNANKQAARRLKNEIGELIADVEDDSDDEEMRQWEQSIVARGGQYAAPEPEAKRKQGYKPAPIPLQRPVPSISSAEARIAQRLAQLKATKLENEQSLENSTKDLVLLEEQERDIRKQVAEVEGKREWVEEFQGWVELLGSFLEEKYPTLEDIEKDAVKFQRERAEMVSKRRAQDDEDDLALFLGVGSTEGDESFPTSEARSVRRTGRTGRRTIRHGHVDTSPEDGWSTDSELDHDIVDDFDAAQHDLERRVVSLLEDVKAEDFRHPEKGIAVRFDDWRQRYPEEYEGAFGGLALVQAWEFWARGEMVGWDPLRSDTQIESFSWFTALYNYSRPRRSADMEEDDMDLEPEVGPDGDLATEMVSKAVVPAVIKALEAGAYDPYSAPQTRRAVDLAEVIGELTGRESKKYMSLVKTVLGVYQSHVLGLATTVASCVQPTAQKPPPYNPAAHAAMQRFVRRRLKLIRNVLLWGRAAPAEVNDLVARTVSVVLRPVLVRTWEEGGRDMAKRVLEVAGKHLTPNLVTFLESGQVVR